jgi:F-type H+-transporting ATPase subunit a
MFLPLAVADPTDDVLPRALFRIGSAFGQDLYFTNHMLTALVAAVLALLVFVPVFTTSSSDAPSGMRNCLEGMMAFMREQVFQPILKQHTDRFLPFLWTLTVFILFCNILGQIPLDSMGTLFTGTEHHINVTATGSIRATFALAICTFIMIHVNGVWQLTRNLIDGTYGHHGQDEHEGHAGHAHEHASHGVSAGAAWLLVWPLYIWNFAPHIFKPGEGESPLWWLLDVPFWCALLVLEILGAAVKPFALMMRLFANMIAGHIVLAALILLIPVTAGFAWQFGIGIPVMLLSLMIRFLELFVAFLQTYIFVFLSALFIASAVMPEH